MQFGTETGHVNIAICYARSIVFNITITDDKKF